MTIETLQNFVNAAKLYERMFKDARTSLMFHIKKKYPKAKKKIDDARDKVNEKIEQIRIELASVDAKGDIIEDRITVGQNLVTSRRYTQKKQLELNKRIHQANADFLTMEVDFEPLSLITIDNIANLDLPFEYLEPFYDIVIKRLTPEEEEAFFLKTTTKPEEKKEEQT